VDSSRTYCRRDPKYYDINSVVQKIKERPSYYIYTAELSRKLVQKKTIGMGGKALVLKMQKAEQMGDLQSTSG
jgi:hypothetical protein